MRKSIAILAWVVLVAFLIVAAVQMRDFGEPKYDDMDQHFLDNSQIDDETNNVVAAVLFDYRGIDTLGEATILFSAVSGVIAVLRKMRKVKRGVESG